MNELIAQPITPPRTWYLVALVILMIGFALAAWGITAFVQKLTDEPQYLFAPGIGEVALEAPGKYTICYEYRGLIDGKSHVSAKIVPGLEARMVYKTTGRQIPLSRLRYSYTYSTGRRAGIGLWSYAIDEPGVYELATWYPEGVDGPDKALLAADHHLGLGGILTMIASVMVALVCSAGALAVFVVTIVRRTSNKKTLQSDAQVAAGNVPPSPMR